MSLLAIKRRRTYMALVALAMLMTGSQAAQAKTIFLTCGHEGTFTIDLTNSSERPRPPFAAV